MRLLVKCLLICALLAPFSAWADCTFDPQRGFFANFDNSCYAIPMPSGNGFSLAGDLDADYNVFWFRTDPDYELIVFGTFPRARYFSISTYDDHSVALSSLYDAKLVSASPSDINPFLPGALWTPGQRWASVVRLGGPPVALGTESPGCSLANSRAYSNELIGYGRHSGVDWTGDSRVPPTFPPHNTSPMQGGAVLVRRYLVDRSLQSPAKVIVRNVHTGCAMPASEALGNWISQVHVTGVPWMGDKAQNDAHRKYANSVQQKMCYGPSPDFLYWIRNAEYVKGINPDAAYLSAAIPGASPTQTQSGAQRYMRLRLRLPSLPNLPCENCTRTGNETLRYWSISLMYGGYTLETLNDSEVVKDPDGFVTIVAGVGPPPPHVTAQNGYTYVDTSAIVNSNERPTSMVIRSILPAPGAQCVANNVSFLFAEHNGVGGSMGEFAPATDMVTADQLPPIAEPLHRPDSCSLAPPEVPGVCSLYFPVTALEWMDGFI